MKKVKPKKGGQEFSFFNANGFVKPLLIDPEWCTRSGAYSLLLAYSNTGEANAGWGISWELSQAGYFDARNFSLLTFWVRGETDEEGFQVGLRDTGGMEVKVEVELTKSGWHQKEIPLQVFTEPGVNIGALENVNLGFNPNHGSGVVCIDDIAFEP